MFHLRLGPFSVGSYDSQGYGGDILSRLYTKLAELDALMELQLLRSPASRTVHLGVGHPFGTHNQISFS
jgi:hypothetical protein